MGLGDDLKSEVLKILQEEWSEREGRVVPASDDLKLSNAAVILDGTVLYADLDDSTKLVDAKDPSFAAEVYKCFLVCAARIIRFEGGEITSYDGDRIMAVFIGDSKNSDAARTALKINYAVLKIVNPAIQEEYPKANYSVKHVVGIDTSSLFVARTGIRELTISFGSVARQTMRPSCLHDPDRPHRSQPKYTISSTIVRSTDRTNRICGFQRQLQRLGIRPYTRLPGTGDCS